jgi:hypothetical protein
VQRTAASALRDNVLPGFFGTVRHELAARIIVVSGSSADRPQIDRRQNESDE